MFTFCRLFCSFRFRNLTRKIRFARIRANNSPSGNLPLITKILLNLYFSPNIVSRTFRQVILVILPLYLVYCHVLVAYIYNVVMPSCATYGCVNSSSKGSDLTFRKIAPEDKKHSRKQWLNNISDDPGYY